MKRLFLLAALGLATATTMPAFSGNLIVKNASKDDTILVKLGNGAKMTLFVENTKQLKSFQNYSLDSLMRTLDKYISEADKNQKEFKGADYSVTYKPSEGDKTKKSPEKITITFKGSDGSGKGKTDMNIDVTYDDKSENKSIVIGKNDGNDTTTVKKEKKNKRTKTDFVLGFGFNSLLNTGKSKIGEQPDLKPYGSRFVSLAYQTQTRIGGPKSPFNIRTAIDFTFNNYMFDGNTVVHDEIINPDDTRESYTWFSKDDSRELTKTKLATSAVNIPVLLVLDFKNAKGKTNFRIGAGGFVGYRLGAHTKIKYSEDGRSRKDHDPGNYNLNDLQYGPKFILAYRDFELFTNYNMNNLFKDNRGMKANTLSFGVNILSI